MCQTRPKDLFSLVCMLAAFSWENNHQLHLQHVRMCGWNNHFPTYLLPSLTITIPTWLSKSTGATGRAHHVVKGWSTPAGPTVQSLVCHQNMGGDYNIRKISQYLLSILYLETVFIIFRELEEFSQNDSHNWFRWFESVTTNYKACHNSLYLFPCLPKEGSYYF